MNSRTPPAPADTKSRILEAAEALARRLGPGNLSLEAVAAEAGVSKGGLLYHFSSKAKLLEALVEHHLSRMDEVLREGAATGCPNATVTAYLSLYLQDTKRQKTPSSGLFAALAENPQLLEPVRRQERDFLARIRADATDPNFATVAFLVVHALKTMKMLGTEVMDDAEARAMIDWLGEELQGRGATQSQ